MNTEVAVLVVEDDKMIAGAHAAYVQRVDGFRLVGVAHTAQDALRLLRSVPTDLILLDLNLPDMNGLELCRTLRGSALEVDVIAVTSNRDLSAVRSAVALGIVQYLLKPFTFRSLHDRLERYRAYRLQMAADAEPASQSGIDQAFASLRAANAGTLPTGLSDETLETIARALQAGRPMSAAEVATACEVSRVTARRYLEHLTTAGAVHRDQRHGGAGRPEIEYTWPPPRL